MVHTMENISERSPENSSLHLLAWHYIVLEESRAPLISKCAEETGQPVTRQCESVPHNSSSDEPKPLLLFFHSVSVTLTSEDKANNYRTTSMQHPLYSTILINSSLFIHHGSVVGSLITKTTCAWTELISEQGTYSIIWNSHFLFEQFRVTENKGDPFNIQSSRGREFLHDHIQARQLPRFGFRVGYQQ